MAKEKQNYTPEMVEKMTTIYVAAGSETGDAGDAKRQAALEEIQKETGKSLHSIRSKLGLLGVYIAKTPAAKKGTNRITKAEMISEVADTATKPDGFFDSLEGATKNVIQYVISLQAEVESLQDELAETDEAENAS